MEYNKKSLNIALITNQDPHHKFWAYHLYRNHNVVAIFHPEKQEGTGAFPKLLKKFQKDRRFGVGWMLLNSATSFYQLMAKDSKRNRIRRAEKKIFDEYELKYNEIPAEIVHHVKSVNDNVNISLIKNMNTDAICMLGGEIAEPGLINAARIASLNFHSGVSPFYNGSDTIYWAVSDFRPNLAGGTLMYLEEKIDGGQIIAHYLPSIKSHDDATSLFMKNIIGAVKLYDYVLRMLASGKKPHGVRQGRSLRFLRDADWTIFQDFKLAYFHKKKLMKHFVRDEKLIFYDNVQENSTPFGELLQHVSVYSLLQ